MVAHAGNAPDRHGAVAPDSLAPKPATGQVSSHGSSREHESQLPEPGVLAARPRVVRDSNRWPAAMLFEEMLTRLPRRLGSRPSSTYRCRCHRRFPSRLTSELAALPSWRTVEALRSVDPAAWGLGRTSTRHDRSNRIDIRPTIKS